MHLEKSTRTLALKIARAVKRLVGKKEGRAWKRGYADDTFHIDEVAEAVVSRFCKEHRITFLSEDAGRVEYSSDVLFLIDPLDGTRNAMRALPNYAVSIAVATNRGGEETLHDLIGGIVYRIDTGEWFTGWLSDTSKKGKEASAPCDTEEEKISIGIGAEFASAYGIHAPFVEALGATRECHIKVYNASALSLAYVAHGRLHAHVDLRILSPVPIVCAGMHDIAAAVCVLSVAQVPTVLLSRGDVVLDPQCKVGFVAARKHVFPLIYRLTTTSYSDFFSSLRITPIPSLHAGK